MHRYTINGVYIILHLWRYSVDINDKTLESKQSTNMRASERASLEIFVIFTVYKMLFSWKIVGRQMTLSSETHSFQVSYNISLHTWYTDQCTFLISLMRMMLYTNDSIPINSLTLRKCMYMRASTRASLENFAFSYSKTAISFNILLVHQILCFRNILISAVNQCSFLLLLMVWCYKNNSIPTKHLTLTK